MAKQVDKDVEAVKTKLLTKPKQTPIPASDFLSSGSILLNLALTGKPNCGFAKGHIYLLVGDSSSGKTFLTMTCLAEAARNPSFKGYRFIQDNPEDGALMDVTGFFGAATAKRIEPPAGTVKEPEFSWTVEQFYRNAERFMSDGPCIYLLDSMDALPAEGEIKKAKKDAKTSEQGKEASGSYGTEKAKAIRKGYREKIMKHIHKSGSIIFFIFQTTQRIGFGATFDPKTRGGGTAPTFFATQELWSSVKCPIKVKVKDHQMQIGAVSKVKIKKNRVAGRPREVEIPFLYQTGFDDIGGCVDYLVEWGHWDALDKKEKGKLYQGRIKAKEWNVSMRREELVRYIENKGLETELKAAVVECWNAVESECTVERKSRYT